ncbi:MAG: amidohydrolase [Pirellulales bacterium]|nr:amidohydrolase [Pirellulales bacterium]
MTHDSFATHLRLPGAVCFCWLLLACPLTVIAQEHADLLLTEAKIHTLDGNLPSASVLAIRGERIIHVGNDVPAELRGPQTVEIKLAGKTVVPGFIDAHCHPRPIYPPDAPWYVVECGPEKVRSLDELIAALKAKADRTPAGEWVTGTNYQETFLGRHPTRHDLDQASTRHPILITHSSGHRSVANSHALELAKVTRDTKSPMGGEIDKDATGEPTGILKESATGLVRRAGPKSTQQPTPEQKIAAYRQCLEEYLAAGITGIHIAGTGADTVAIIQEAQAEAPVRCYVMLREGDLKEAVWRKRAQPAGTPLVRYGAIKLYHGNSLSGQTCWLSQPYERRPDDFGVPPARTQEELNALIEKIHLAGLQACVHANGDREIDMLLTAFEQVLERHPRADHRHRIEHCSVVTAEILARIKKLELVIAPHSYIYEHGDKMEAYGAWRWKWMHPNRALFDLGVTVAGNSDSPVSAARPLLRMQDLVRRESFAGKIYGAEQCISPEQALASWTIHSARGGFGEATTGSLEVGKYADLVVLGADPLEVPTDKIKDIIVERTYVGGNLAYQAAKP